MLSVTPNSTMRQLTGQCVKIKHFAKEVFKRIHSLFFLNQQDNASQVMLMVDFQKIRFPEYPGLYNLTAYFNMTYERYTVWGHSIVNNAITLSKNCTIPLIGSSTEVEDVGSSSTLAYDTTSNPNTSTTTTTTTTTTNATSNTITKTNFEVSSRPISLSPNHSSLFPTREALLAYETAVVFSNDMQRGIAEQKPDDALEIMQIAAGFLERKSSDDMCSKKPSYDFSVRFSAPYVYCSIVTVGISILESLKRYHKHTDPTMLIWSKRYTEANELLKKQLEREECPGRRGDWWNRLAVNLGHLARPKECMAVCEQALADPLVRSGDRLKLERRLARLCKPPLRWKVPHHLLYLLLSFLPSLSFILLLYHF